MKLSDAKMYLISLQRSGLGYSSIHNIRGVIRPAFRMAYDDDLIRKNPFDFELASVVVNDSVTREAITRVQERQYLKFIKEDQHFCKYYDAIYILFKTGLKIAIGSVHLPMAKIPSGTDFGFTTYFTTFAFENMPRYAKICEND